MNIGNPKETAEVTLVLKDDQHREHNKWACTIRGEDRLVTQKSVSFIHFPLKTVHESFIIDECESFVIKSI